MAKRKTAVRRKRRSYGGGKVNILDFEAMIYGGIRPYVSRIVSPLASRIPMVGNLAGMFGDEVMMGTLNYFIAKNMKGRLRNFAKKGLIIENANAGATLSSNFSLGMGGTKTKEDNSPSFRATVF